MSRGGGYYEVENRRRLERQRQAALARARQLWAAYEEARIAILASGHRAASDAGGPRIKALPPESASTSELVEWATTVEPAVEALSRLVAAQRSEQQAADLAEHLRAIVRSGELASPYVSGPAKAAPTRSSHGSDRRQPSLEELTTRIETAVAALDGDATKDERDRVREAAAAVLAPSTLSPETLLTELRALVQRCGTSATKRRADRTKAIAVLRGLDGVIGAEVEDLRDVLHRVVAGTTPFSSVDESRAADIRARAIAVEDEQYVAEHLAEAFAELGYEVGPDFASDLTRGEPAYALVPTSADHAVELAVESGRYSYRLVHTVDVADSTRDAELELALCKAFGKVTAEAHDKGLTFAIDDHRPAGSEVVPFVAAAGSSRRRATANQVNLRQRKR